MQELLGSFIYTHTPSPPQTDLVMDDGIGQAGTDDARDGCEGVGQPHQNAGVLGGDVQVVHTEPPSPPNPPPPCELTLSWTMAPVRLGLTMPGMVAKVLDSPIRMLAYWGAMSKWFTTLNPPPSPPNPHPVN